MSQRIGESIEEYRKRHRKYVANRRRLLESKQRMPQPKQNFMTGFHEVAGHFFDVHSSLDPFLMRGMIDYSELSPKSLKIQNKFNRPKGKWQAHPLPQ